MTEVNPQLKALLIPFTHAKAVQEVWRHLVIGTPLVDAIALAVDTLEGETPEGEGWEEFKEDFRKHYQGGFPTEVVIKAQECLTGLMEDHRQALITGVISEAIYQTWLEEQTDCPQWKKDAARKKKMSLQSSNDSDFRRSLGRVAGDTEDESLNVLRARPGGNALIENLETILDLPPVFLKIGEALILVDAQELGRYEKETPNTPEKLSEAIDLIQAALQRRSGMAGSTH